MIESTIDRSVPRPPVRWGKPIPEPPADGGEIHGRSQIPLWERLGWCLMLGLLLLGLPMAYQRAIDNGPDLAGFCDAGRYILEHGTRQPLSTLSRYWPSADVPWILFALLPISVAAVLWYAIGCATWLGLLRTIFDRMLVGLDPVAKRHATLAAGLLAMPLVIDGLCLGSFHVLMVWLMILGLDRACRGEETAGGILLGTAAWLKLLPLLGIGYLLYQRRWKGALIAMATVLVLDVALSVAAFGPAGAWREHVLWWQDGATATADRQLTSAKAGDEDRLTNQSVAITLRRLLTSLGTAEMEGTAAGPRNQDRGGTTRGRRPVPSPATGPACRSDACATPYRVPGDDGDPGSGRGDLLSPRPDPGVGPGRSGQDRNDDAGHDLVLAGRLELSFRGRHAGAGHPPAARALPLAVGRAGHRGVGRGIVPVEIRRGPRRGRALVDEPAPGRGACPVSRDNGYSMPNVKTRSDQSQG